MDTSRILIYVTFLIAFSLISSPQSAYSQSNLNYGLTVPQDRATLPTSLAPAPKTVRKPKVPPKTTLIPVNNNEFQLHGGWELTDAYGLKQTGSTLSKPGVFTKQWYNAVVPGTVLTTLVDQGVYPNPYIGLNNMYIPDSLCRKDWWYRTSFKVPSGKQNQTVWLLFDGINYEAQVWLNGKNLGDIKGAFKRGSYNISTILNKSGENVLAVHIIPPPNPGIPHEQSALAGMGPNGGQLALDGPTFISSEGWDWIPGIRDRNIGIWQPVKIKFTGPLTIADPQIITDLSLPDTTIANITVKTTIANNSTVEQKAVVNGSIEGISFSKTVKLAPGEQKLVSFSPEQYSQLKLRNPRLWWPNGYGNQALYKAKITVRPSSQNAVSDEKTVRFGVRELSYELMIDTPERKGWRVSYSPTNINIEKPLLNYSEKREVVKGTSIASLRDGIDESEFKDVGGDNPFLVIKVNGVKIYCRGGNWGMDDGMKRVSRERLEPAFRLHKEANYNMIRNWTGESTEEVFYDLADEYGMLVWNDFWISTQGYNLNPADSKLFLSNSLDVIKRFRNHPSIAIWCPRNEGYAPDGIEDELATQIAKEDGTRHYIGNSREMNLRNSGGWHYVNDPKEYFTKYAQGFSTEIGTFSVPTANTIRKFIKKEDQWPISDVWHYHDLHSNKQNLEGYLGAVDSLYGRAQSLDDFCKKVQLVNYDSHRAMFEAWNSKLWKDGSGVLLWMTHPAWPSMIWQTYSWDFETHGSYFGAKKACSPLHVQMNLDDNQVVAVNTTLNEYKNTLVQLKVFDLEGKEIFSKEQVIDFAANNKQDVFIPDFSSVKLPDVYLVKLYLTSGNKTLAENSYWKSIHDFSAFNALPNVKLAGKILKREDGKTQFTIANTSKTPVIGVKLNLVDENHNILLPAYFSDGYFTLLPGESKTIEVSYAFGKAKKLSVKTEGYNNTGDYIAIQ